jgi:MYXO-CTERM domain-containing protein
VVREIFFVAGLLSAATVIPSNAMAQNGFGGSLQLFSGTGDAAWVAGEDGATEWLDDGYRFTGSDSSGGWNVNWDMLGASGMNDSITLNFTVTNLSSTTQTFFLFATQEIDALESTLAGGSIAGSFTDLNGDGVTVSSVAGDSIFTGFYDATAFDPFDGTVIATLLDDTTASAGSFLSGNYDAAAFGDFPVIPGQVAGSVDFNFGIGLRFDVSAGDTAAFTSSMAVGVPGPGALALMGLAGMHRRRRRD